MKKSLGFTLIEVMMVLAFILLFAAFAIPSYRMFVLRNHQTAEINTLTNAINFARSEAIKRHAIITICPNAHTISCEENWSSGWIVFVDTNNSATIINPENILQRYGEVPTNTELVWRGTLGKNYLQITPQGISRQSGTFTFYPDSKNSEISSEVIVSPTSRIRVVTNN